MNPNSVSNIPIVKEQKNLIYISTLEPFYPEDNCNFYCVSILKEKLNISIGNRQSDIITIY